MTPAEGKGEDFGDYPQVQAAAAPRIENEEPCGTSVPHTCIALRSLAPPARVGVVQCGEYKVEYETINIEEYEAKYKEQQIKYMKKTCVEPVETKPPSSASNSSRRRTVRG